MKYVEYIAENLDKTVQYTEYIAEQLNSIVGTYAYCDVCGSVIYPNQNNCTICNNMRPIKRFSDFVYEKKEISPGGY